MTCLRRHVVSSSGLIPRSANRIRFLLFVPHHSFHTSVRFELRLLLKFQAKQSLPKSHLPAISVSIRHSVICICWDHRQVGGYSSPLWTCSVSQGSSSEQVLSLLLRLKQIHSSIQERTNEESRVEMSHFNFLFCREHR